MVRAVSPIHGDPNPVCESFAAATHRRTSAASARLNPSSPTRNPRAGVEVGRHSPRPVGADPPRPGSAPPCLFFSTPTGANSFAIPGRKFRAPGRIFRAPRDRFLLNHPIYIAPLPSNPLPSRIAGNPAGSRSATSPSLKARLQCVCSC